MRAIAIGAISITILVFASAVTVRLAIGQADSVCVTGTAVATSTPSLIVDCEILLEIKPALRGTAQLNWWSGRSIEKWDGIKVQGGRVTELSLPNRNLDGILPVGLGSLSALTTLDLSSNSLTGTIPTELNNLTTLTRWRLAGNSFSGCVPYNFAQVSDNDAASLGLTTCGGGTTTPTPVPTATPAPTPTPTDDLAELLALAHCNQSDLTEALGNPHTLIDAVSPVGYEHNGWGLQAFTRSSWVNDSDSDKRVVCITLLYENTSSAILDAGYDRMKSLVEGSLDVLEQRKVGNLPEIGHKFRALQIQLGEERIGTGDDNPLAGVTVSIFRRGRLAVFVSEGRLGNNVNPRFQRAAIRPPPVDGVVNVSQRIDSRLVDELSESAYGSEITQRGAKAKDVVNPTYFFDRASLPLRQ